MSTRENLIEEIKHQPEPGLRELRRYMNLLKLQHSTEAQMTGVLADTWEKPGPAPEGDDDKL